MNTTESRPVDDASREPAKSAPEGLTTAALAGAQPTSEREPEARSFAPPASSEAPNAPGPVEESATPLLSVEEAGDLRAKWDEVQTGFVDEPRNAVQQADSLVAGAMQRLAEVFAQERSRLEGQWDRGDEVSTEDLRVALRRYRSFFTRLLSV